MNGFWGGFLSALSVMYLTGFALTAVVELRDKPWRVSPRPAKWAYRPWGIPVAVLLGCLIWPLGAVYGWWRR